MGNPLWFLVWLLILWFVSFFLAVFCAGWYIVLYPLTVCIPSISGITDILMQGIQFPHLCARSMMDCKPLC